MLTIIDGYNLLRGAASWGPVKSLGQLNLCELLGRWSVISGHKVTIIFDGGEPPSGYGRQLQMTGIRVLYSGAGRSADELLIDEIRRCSAPRRLSVVSADREIRAAARRRRCREVDPEAFFASMCSRLAASKQHEIRTNEPDTKRRGLDEGDLHFWLTEFGLTGEDDGMNTDHSARS
ncbi:MAG: NYN domain-containing protein [Phycisphaerales bacterium]|nr:NYN domain-containing protein [Phycisphaerales bacterium]